MKPKFSSSFQESETIFKCEIIPPFIGDLEITPDASEANQTCFTISCLKFPVYRENIETHDFKEALRSMLEKIKLDLHEAYFLFGDIKKMQDLSNKTLNS